MTSDEMELIDRIEAFEDERRRIGVQLKTASRVHRVGLEKEDAYFEKSITALRAKVDATSSELKTQIAQAMLQSDNVDQGGKLGSVRIPLNRQRTRATALRDLSRHVTQDDLERGFGFYRALMIAEYKGVRAPPNNKGFVQPRSAFHHHVPYYMTQNLLSLILKGQWAIAHENGTEAEIEVSADPILSRQRLLDAGCPVDGIPELFFEPTDAAPTQVNVIPAPTLDEMWMSGLLKQDPVGGKAPTSIFEMVWDEAAGSDSPLASFIRALTVTHLLIQVAARAYGSGNEIDVMDVKGFRSAVSQVCVAGGSLLNVPALRRKNLSGLQVPLRALADEELTEALVAWEELGDDDALTPSFAKEGVQTNAAFWMGGTKSAILDPDPDLFYAGKPVSLNPRKYLSRASADSFKKNRTFAVSPPFAFGSDMKVDGILCVTTTLTSLCQMTSLALEAHTLLSTLETDDHASAQGVLQQMFLSVVSQGTARAKKDSGLINDLLDTVRMKCVVPRPINTSTDLNSSRSQRMTVHGTRVKYYYSTGPIECEQQETLIPLPRRFFGIGSAALGSEEAALEWDSAAFLAKRVAANAQTAQEIRGELGMYPDVLAVIDKLSDGRTAVGYTLKLILLVMEAANRLGYLSTELAPRSCSVMVAEESYLRAYNAVKDGVKNFFSYSKPYALGDYLWPQHVELPDGEASTAMIRLYENWRLILNSFGSTLNSREGVISAMSEVAREKSAGSMEAVRITVDDVVVGALETSKVADGSDLVSRLGTEALSVKSTSKKTLFSLYLSELLAAAGTDNAIRDGQAFLMGGEKVYLGFTSDRVAFGGRSSRTTNLSRPYTVPGQKAVSICCKEAGIDGHEYLGRNGEMVPIPAHWVDMGAVTQGLRNPVRAGQTNGVRSASQVSAMTLASLGFKPRTVLDPIVGLEWDYSSYDAQTTLGQSAMRAGIRKSRLVAAEAGKERIVRGNDVVFVPTPISIMKKGVMANEHTRYFYPTTRASGEVLIYTASKKPTSMGVTSFSNMKVGVRATYNSSGVISTGPFNGVLGGITMASVMTTSPRGLLHVEPDKRYFQSLTYGLFGDDAQGGMKSGGNPQKLHQFPHYLEWCAAEYGMTLSASSDIATVTSVGFLRHTIYGSVQLTRPLPFGQESLAGAEIDNRSQTIAQSAVMGPIRLGAPPKVVRALRRMFVSGAATVSAFGHTTFLPVANSGLGPFTSESLNTSEAHSSIPFVGASPEEVAALTAEASGWRATLQVGKTSEDVIHDVITGTGKGTFQVDFTTRSYDKEVGALRVVDNNALTSGGASTLRRRLRDTYKDFTGEQKYSSQVANLQVLRQLRDRHKNVSLFRDVSTWDPYHEFETGVTNSMALAISKRQAPKERLREDQFRGNFTFKRKEDITRLPTPGGTLVLQKILIGSLTVPKDHKRLCVLKCDTVHSAIAFASITGFAREGSVVSWERGVLPQDQFALEYLVPNYLFGFDDSRTSTTTRPLLPKSDLTDNQLLRLASAYSDYVRNNEADSLTASAKANAIQAILGLSGLKDESMLLQLASYKDFLSVATDAIESYGASSFVTSLNAFPEETVDVFLLGSAGHVDASTALGLIPDDWRDDFRKLLYSIIVSDLRSQVIYSGSYDEQGDHFTVPVNGLILGVEDN